MPDIPIYISCLTPHWQMTVQNKEFKFLFECLGSGDEQSLPNGEAVAQYLCLFSAIYLVTQTSRYIL
jgi:hypothetical protein